MLWVVKNYYIINLKVHFVGCTIKPSNHYRCPLLCLLVRSYEDVKRILFLLIQHVLQCQLVIWISFFFFFKYNKILLLGSESLMSSRAVGYMFYIFKANQLI